MFACKSKEYEYTEARVYKAEWYVYSRGYYKQRIYYEFEYNAEILRDTYNMSNQILPQVGDSLLIRFPINEPHKSKIVKLFTKRKQIIKPDTVYSPDSSSMFIIYK